MWDERAPAARSGECTGLSLYLKRFWHMPCLAGSKVATYGNMKLAMAMAVVEITLGVMNTAVVPSPAAKSSSAPQEKRVEEREKIPVPVVAAIIGVAGSLLIAGLVHRWSRTREKEARFATAATRFRQAFASDIAAIEEGNIGSLDLPDYLRLAYKERHAAAVVEFEPFVSQDKLPGFRKAWDRYRYGENSDGTIASPDDEGLSHEDLLFLGYGFATFETHAKQSAKDRALARVRALLAHAQ
jgi:hypothetical protein